MRRSLLTLCALAVVTFALGLGQPAITDADEAYYAEASREMVTSGDWLSPRYNFADRWQKPVLYYWLTAATFTVAGPSEWAARAWAALSGVGLVLLTWRFARGDGGANSSTAPPSDDSAWLAGAIVATCFGYFAMARSALPDLPLAWCITATIGLGLRAGDTAASSAWLLTGLAAGAGFLMKGPVALAVPAVVLGPIWWLERHRTRVSVRGLLMAGAVAALVGLPWYAAMTATHGLPYLQSFFVADNLERFATSRFNEPRPLWFYPAVIAGGMLPWSLFAVGPLVRVVRDTVGRRLSFPGHERRLVVWAGLPLLLFMASVGQQPRYVLPVLPPLAILLARAITRRALARQASSLMPATWAAAVVFVLLAGALVRLRPMLLTVHPWAPIIGSVALSAAGAILGATAFSGAWHRLPARVSACAATLLLVVQFGALAGRRPEPVEQIAAAIRAHRSHTEPVGPYRVLVRNLVFYTGFKQEDLFDRDAAIRFLASPERVLLVAPLDEVAGIAQAAGVSARELARVTYLNTANLRLDALLHPNPATQLETVVLVTNR